MLSGLYSRRSSVDSGKSCFFEPMIHVGYGTTKFGEVEEHE